MIAPKAPGRLKLTRPEPKETQVLKAVLRALELHPRVAKAWRVNTGAGKLSYRDGSLSQFLRFGFEGCPDIHGFMKDGRALYVEVKRPSGRASEAQTTFIESAKQCGCVAFFARRVDDVMQELALVGADRQGI